MANLIIYLSIIPWILYYSINLFKTLIDMDKQKISSLFRFDSVILILIFVYFVRFNKTFVIQMLFATINLYFFINRLYERNINDGNIKKVIASNKLLLFLLYLFVIIFLMMSYKFLKLSYFYFSLFVLNFFISGIVYSLKRLELFK